MPGQSAPEHAGVGLPRRRATRRARAERRVAAPAGRSRLGLRLGRRQRLGHEQRHASSGTSPGYAGSYGQAAPGEPAGRRRRQHPLHRRRRDRRGEARRVPPGPAAPEGAPRSGRDRGPAVQEGVPGAAGRPAAGGRAAAPGRRAAAGPTDYDGAYEDSQLDALDRQIGQPEVAPPAGRERAAAPRGRGRLRSRPLSIADELASLQRRVPPRGSARERRRRPRRPARPHPPVVADKVSDRNGDGRPDLWQYRENGVAGARALRRERRRPRRPHHPLRPGDGPEADRRGRRNVDGLVDSWVEYRGGQVVRRRQDANGDGQPDSWTLYRGAQLARVEEDRDGDGFRDRVGYYQDGPAAARGRGPRRRRPSRPRHALRRRRAHARAHRGPSTATAWSTRARSTRTASSCAAS